MTAKASSGSRSRVPLSIARLCASCLCTAWGSEVAGHMTGNGPNMPTNSATVSSAPVRSSASSFRVMRSTALSAKTSPAREIRHHRADAEGPVLALVAAPHAVDELSQFRRTDGDDVVALVGKTLARRVAVLHRRKHRAEEQRKSIRVLMHGADG